MNTQATCILMPSGLWGTSLGLGDYSCRMGVGGIQGSRFVTKSVSGHIKTKGIQNPMKIKGRIRATFNLILIVAS